MPTTWLVLDCSNLGYRALHTTGDLSHEDEPTGVIFGICREIATLCSQYETRAVIPCFDVGKSKREEAFPYYKETRRKKVRTDEENRKRDEMYAQLNTLRRGTFEELGITNSLWEKGLEADDLMAAAVRSLPPGDRAILVTSDQDVYQLLGKNVAVHNPHTKQFLTAKWFKEEKGIRPDEWVKVKCLAGCGTDDVPGIEGVAEATAIKFLKGEIKQNATWRRIQEFKASQQYADNVKLVTLLVPFWGNKPRYELDLEGLIDPTMWDMVLGAKYGMTTLCGAFGNSRARQPVG
jgi:5'-3' exonuclease